MKRELNLRDLGGIGNGIVPKGLFIRSGKLSILTPDECTGLCNRYNIKCVIDLRTPVESAEFPDPLPESVVYLQIPLSEEIFMIQDLSTQNMAQTKNAYLRKKSMWIVSLFQ